MEDILHMIAKRQALEENTTDTDFGSLTEWFDPVPKDLMVIFYTTALVYIFVGIYVLTDYFLLPSLDSLVSKTAATPSIGGSLVIAGATCVLPLVTSIIQVFTALGDEGTSKMLGSQVYAYTFLAGLTILLVPGSLLKPLQLQPLLRDVLYAALMNISIFCYFLDGRLELYEIFLLLLSFCIYLILARVLRNVMNTSSDKIEPSNTEMEESDIEGQEKTEEKTTPELSLKMSSSSCLDTSLHILSLPAKTLLKITIPPPNLKLDCGFPVLPLTLLLCFVWLGFFSWIMVMVATDLGRLLGIPPEVLGILIAPISIDVISCVILARRGDLTLAIHSILGRNIIHSSLTLPLPLLLHYVVFLPENIKVDASGGSFTLTMTMLAIIILILEVVCKQGRLTKPMGIAPVVLFVLFFITSLALAYGFIQMPVDF